MIREGNKINLSSLATKTPQRLRQLRRKYRRLKWNNEDGGAGEDRVSDEFKYFSEVLAEIDRLEVATPTHCKHLT